MHAGHLILTSSFLYINKSNTIKKSLHWMFMSTSKITDGLDSEDEKHNGDMHFTWNTLQMMINKN